MRKADECRLAALIQQVARRFPSVPDRVAVSAFLYSEVLADLGTVELCVRLHIHWQQLRQYRERGSALVQHETREGGILDPDEIAELLRPREPEW